MSSNVGQSYPYASEDEAQRADAVSRALERFDGLRDKVAAGSTPLGEIAPDERWWVWVCPADDFSGRLHVAGYAAERHGLFTICDSCGRTYLR